LDVEFHDGVERVGYQAFHDCLSFLWAKLPGVVVIDEWAFEDCVQLTDVEFGNKLEIIEEFAFWNCRCLKNIVMPSILRIEEGAFYRCDSLTDAEFGEGLETIGKGAFEECSSLRRIALPLKDNLFTFDDDIERYNQFDGCERLTTVEIVGGERIHKTISYLSLQSWRNEMNQEINCINQFLPTTPADDKTGVIQEWIQSVLRQIEHYKSEHHNLLKEATILLELALWKAKLCQKKEEEDSLNTTKARAKKAEIDVESARQERRVTCGADIIIKNVLPFLKLPST
jgi:hypothetical protein